MTGQQREALTAHIAQRVREARAGKDWSQAQLAMACGWTQATISRYEDGHRRTGIYELCTLAEKLERPLAFFLDDLLGRAALAAREEPQAAGDRTITRQQGGWQKPTSQPSPAGRAAGMPDAAREDTERPRLDGVVLDRGHFERIRRAEGFALFVAALGRPIGADRRRKITLDRLIEKATEAVGEDTERPDDRLEKLRETIVELRHKTPPGSTPELHDCLGMTWAEYQEWVLSGAEKDLLSRAAEGVPDREAGRASQTRGGI